jgi:TonB family protein
MDSAQGPVSTELEQAHTAPDFGAHTPLSEKLLAIAIRAQNFTGSSGIAIALTEGQEMICRANWGTSAPEVGTRLSVEHSFTGLCVRAGEPQRCDDAQSDPRVDAEACRALGISAIAAAPVRRGLKVIGVIAAFSDTPNAFTHKHLLILSTLSEVIVELLEDPVQPLPPIVAGVPDLARAAAAVQATVAPLAGSVTVTARVKDSATFQPEAAIAATAPNLAEPPVEVPVPSAAGESVALVQLPPVDATLTPPSGASTSVGIARASAPERATARRENAARRPTEILPAAMDPGSLPNVSKTSAQVVPFKTPEKPFAEVSATDTPTFAALGDSTPHPRWLLPAAVVAIVAVLGIAGWRWQVARKASTATQSSAPLQQPQAPQPDVAQEGKASGANSIEPQNNPFSPPQMTTVAPPAKTKPTLELAADVPLRRTPQPVVETAGPVRRPGTTGVSKVAQVPEAQPPQLALAAPDLPTVLAKPAAAAVTAPVSRVAAAQLVRRVEPIYPEAARRLRLSGKVVVKATITKAGNVGNVRWVSGSDLFRDATVAAVKQWRYKPASLNNQPIESDLEIVLQFNRPTNQ